MKKEIISLVMALSLCAGLVVPAFAVDTIQIEEMHCEDETSIVVTDDGVVRTVVSCDGVIEYTMTFDRIADAVSISSRDIQTGEVHDVTLVVEHHSVDVPHARATIEMTTLAKFKYVVKTGSRNEWYLERPKLSDEGTGTFYFMCWENNSNETYLNTYKTAVNNMSVYEANLSAKQTTEVVDTLLMIFLAGATIATDGVLTPSLISSGIALAGVQESAKVAAQQVAIGFNDCMFAIEDVFYHTDNTHY